MYRLCCSVSGPASGWQRISGIQDGLHLAVPDLGGTASHGPDLLAHDDEHLRICMYNLLERAWLQLFNAALESNVSSFAHLAGPQKLKHTS